MNSVNKTDLGTQQTTYWEEQAFEKQFNSFNKQLQRNEKVIILIKFTFDQKIIYSQNGTVLRMYNISTTQKIDQMVQMSLISQKLLKNLDQLCNLSWESKYDQNNKREGKWIAFWNKALLKNVGGYQKDGQKLGLWKDLFLNYSKQDTKFNITNSEVQIYEIGEYNKDYKIGKWNYFSNKERIGGGFYNKNGQKQGKWVEVDEGFYKYAQVTNNGEYNMNNYEDRQMGYYVPTYLVFQKKKHFEMIDNIKIMQSGQESKNDDCQIIFKYLLSKASDEKNIKKKFAQIYTFY